MRGTTIVLLLLAALATGGSAKPRAQQTKGSASHLEHEVTNRVIHGDRSRHHDHPNQHHSAAALPSSTSSSSSSGEHEHEHKHQHSNNRPADHTVHKKLLLEQQEDELLEGERLMHVKPRKAQRLNATSAATGAGPMSGSGGKRKSGQQPLSSKAVKLSNGQQGKQFSAAKLGRGGAGQGGKGSKGSNPLTKEYKGRRQAKKYNPKKHAWKKTAHKDKLLKNRQTKKDMKDKKDKPMTKKEKVMNKEMMKAKELLRKEKAFKKRERREKRAKVMAYRKRD